MDDYRCRAVLRVCDQYRRGFLTVAEACSCILFSCVEPKLVAEYVALLPDDLRAAFVTLLPTLPESDEEWCSFQGVGQLDGSDWSWAQMIVACRANTEAARAYLFGEISPPAAVDFMDRVRVARRAYLDEFCRKHARRQETPDGPGAGLNDDDASK